MSNEGREQVSRPPIREGRPVGEHPENCSCIPCDYARLRSRITALEAELDAEKAKVAKLRKAMVEIRDRKARNILPWTHEQAADEYARMLDADRMTARRIHEETA